MTSTAIRRTMTAVSMSETIAGYSSADLAAMEKLSPIRFVMARRDPIFLQIYCGWNFVLFDRALDAYPKSYPRQWLIPPVGGAVFPVARASAARGPRRRLGRRGLRGPDIARTLTSDPENHPLESRIAPLLDAGARQRRGLFAGARGGPRARPRAPARSGSSTTARCSPPATTPAPSKKATRSRSGICFWGAGNRLGPGPRQGLNWHPSREHSG